MAKGKGGNKSEQESAMEIVGVFAACIFVFIALIWLFASNRIVWNSLSPMLFFGSVWRWIPSDFTYSQWNNLVNTAIQFSRNPGEVSIFDWNAFVSLALLPLAILSFVSYLPFCGWLLLRKRSQVTRRISPDMLLNHTLSTFTGIAPVLAIRKKIVDNKLKEWRVQYTPEEVFNGSAGNRSMVVTGEFDRDTATEYFMGVKPGSMVKGKLIHSKTLGRQLVDLTVDRTGKPIVFTDRFSEEGKVLVALWSAVAFNQQDGKDEYKLYCDLLNRSAYGSPTGAANLSVAEPLFQKYRKNKQLMQLFAVHHWEHTLLFSLLEIAQTKGRYTTAEILWLRPMNRIMFFSLNSCGSRTPHTEAAATFSQFGYERACHQNSRLPLMRGSDGSLVHVISINRCVEGLQAEYEHWKISTDDNRDWWSDKNLWRTKDAAMSRVLADANKVNLPPEPPGPDAAFDVQQKTARDKIEDDEKAMLQGLVAKTAGKDGLSAFDDF